MLLLDESSGSFCPDVDNLVISSLHPLPILKDWAAASTSHFSDSLTPCNGSLVLKPIRFRLGQVASALEVL